MPPNFELSHASVVPTPQKGQQQKEKTKDKEIKYIPGKGFRRVDVSGYVKQINW